MICCFVFVVSVIVVCCVVCHLLYIDGCMLFVVFRSLRFERCLLCVVQCVSFVVGVRCSTFVVCCCMCLLLVLRSMLFVV